ncbi:MAG TPA: putative monovalent cation/H+ antiporter subunit A [Gemmataceae bacterium]|nr:putative monovalent cation/H+ antiporter subunit A [Gemmataceae bacterium]
MYRYTGRAAGWALALLPLALTVYFASFLGVIGSGETLHVHRDWVPALGVNLSFTLDGLSLLFALLISGVGALVLVYAGGYLAGRPQLGRFYAFLLMFMASMLGLVLADNLLTLFVFWELTSLSSYLLIGFEHERAGARAAALQALLVTGGGGLALLAGLLLLGQAGGSLELSTLLGRGDQIGAHPLYVPALLLILAGAFTKSAQFPFHFWLPAAMEAPTPVSAYLHSATMVKAGVYLLARLSPALGSTDLWVGAVSFVGGITMLAGAWLALVQSDLKRILAYSTVSALGTLTLLLGLGRELAVHAAMAYLLGHALYKGALFLVAGALDHGTGTREVDRLGGLGRAMPVTALAAGVVALSMAGLPPLFGFIAKELSYEATLHAPAAGWVMTAAVVANVPLVAAALMAGFRPFLGKARPTPRPAHEAPPSLWLGPLALAGLSVAFGLWPGWGADGLVSAASTSVLGQPSNAQLALWHGLTPALALSAVTLAGGIGVYAGRGLLRKATSWWERAAQWGPTGWYELALNGLNGLALGQTRLLQSGYLRYYLMITVAATVGLAGYALVGRGPLIVAVSWSDLRFYEAGLAALILLAVLAAVLAKARLAAIAALGVVGYGVALIFVLFGAPDLAMTQFLVETLTVILFVLVFYHLPESRIVSGRAARWRDAALAAAAGALMTALVLVGTPENYPPISAYFAKHSVAEGHGRNVVNVILVDFRGLDTLGEITVLAVAGLGVYALLKLRRRADGGGESRADQAPARATDGLPQEGPAGEAGSDGEAGSGERNRSVPAAGIGEGEGP